MPDSLAIIEESGLLDSQDAQHLVKLAAEIEKTFHTVQRFRTETEMRVSVLNDFRHPTPDAKYWQAVREQDAHVNELVFLGYRYREADIELRKLQRRLELEDDDLERELLELKIDQKQYQIVLMGREARHRVREIKLWSKLKAELEPRLEYGTEDVNRHQLKAMQLRWSKEAQLVSSHTPPADAFNILSLAEAARKAGLES